MRTIILGLALISAPVSASCTDPGELAFQALNLADAGFTSDVLHHGGVEHNPIFGHHPSDTRLFGTKLAIGVAHCGFRSFLQDRNESTKFFDYASIGFVGAGLGITIHAKLKQ